MNEQTRHALTDIRRRYAAISLDADIAQAAATVAAAHAKDADDHYRDAVAHAAAAAIDAAAGNGPPWQDQDAAEIWSHAADAQHAATEAAQAAAAANNAAEDAAVAFRSCEIVLVETEPHPDGPDPEDDETWVTDNAAEAMTYYQDARRAATRSARYAAEAQTHAARAADAAAEADYTTRRR